MLDEECQSASPSWSCTHPYNNTLYAKYLCPFNNQTCGSNDTYNMNKVGEFATLNFTLTRGDVCFYKVRTGCDARLTVNVSQLENSDTIIIEYLEHSNDLILLAKIQTDVMHGRWGGAPGLYMPWRTESWVSDTFERGVYQGRLFFGQGLHYWGNNYQGETPQAGDLNSTAQCT